MLNVLPLAHVYVFPGILLSESKRWAAVALMCALALAVEAMLAWRARRRSRHGRSWRILAAIALLAMLGALGIGVRDLWAYAYYASHQSLYTGATAAGGAELIGLQSLGEFIATVTVILIAAGAIAAYNTLASGRSSTRARPEHRT